MNYFNLHTHQFTDQPDILELVNQYPLEFDSAVSAYSIGIHPWHINEESIDSELHIIEDKMQDVNCLAIGECGLDKRIAVPLELQIAVFEKQLFIAEKHNKPVVIHCVAAFQEVIAIKKKKGVSVPMVIHGFSKNATLASQLLKEGFFLSFGKDLMLNPQHKDVFKDIPNNRFFLETDTIDKSIEDVYKQAATYKEMAVGELKETISDNFKHVFKAFK
jgi:TatD DNase family protein